MKFSTIDIFPTTLYLGEIQNHELNKRKFYEIYHKFDYEENEKNNTVSENTGNPLIHHEDVMDPLFKQIIFHAKNYCSEVLKLKDIFNFAITKTWISRARKSKDEIRMHIHSTSHISFVYYLNTPADSHVIKFSNKNQPNSLFLGITAENKDKDLMMIKDYTKENCDSFFLHPNEGMLLMFPSSLPHCTSSISESFCGERLSIVGDITLILKEEYLSYSMGYIDPKYWKIYK